MVVKKKTAKVEAVDLEEEKLRMLIGNVTDAPSKIIKKNIYMYL